MGCRTSKLDVAQAMFKAWVTPAGALTLSHRQRLSFTKDQLLSPLELPDASMARKSDPNHKNDNVRESREDSIMGTAGGEKGEDDVVESEDDQAHVRGHTVRCRSVSPSFRVYCLDTGRPDEEEERPEEEEDVASVNSHPNNTAVMLTQQSSHNSNDEGLVKIHGKERRRGRRLIQKDMFKGVGKNVLLQLKLPHHHRRSSSAGVSSHHRTDEKQQPRTCEDDAGKSSHRHHHRHHSQIPHISHQPAAAVDDCQEDHANDNNNHRTLDVIESGCHRDHVHQPGCVKLPPISHDDDDNKRHTCDTSEPSSRHSHGHDHHHNHNYLRFPHMACWADTGRHRPREEKVVNKSV